MAGAVASGKIAFLVNSAPLRNEERCQAYYRQLCMATIRLLLFLSSFPRRKPTANLRWYYRLYDSEKACLAATVGLRTEPFLELNSATLETYFSELKAHMGSNQNMTDQPAHSRVLASALGSLVLELPWDKPELHSPNRYSRIAPGPTRKMKQRGKPTDLSSIRDNLVFVMSDCPHSAEDLAAFFSHRVHLPSAELKGRGSDTKGMFLSDDLSAQLKKCSMALHWVDTAPALGKTQLDYAGLSAISTILQYEEGGVLPVSSLVLPLEEQPLLSNSLEGQSLPFKPLEGQFLPPEPLEGQFLPPEPLEGQSLPPEPFEGLPLTSKPLERQSLPPEPFEGLPLTSKPLERQSLPPEPFEGLPLPSKPLDRQSLPPEPLEGQALSLEQQCRDSAAVSMASNSQSLVNSSIKRARGPGVSHAVPPSVWLRRRLQPGKVNTQMRKKKGEICERRSGLPLFQPDGAPICFLEGSVLTPLSPEETQSHAKHTVSLRLSSSKEQATKMQTLPQAAQKEISPEIPVQSSVMSTRSTEGQSPREVPSSVAVVLAVLPRQEVPLSWLHQTEVYICGGYCYREPKGKTAANSGRETTASRDSPGVALQACVHQVKVVTDATWFISSEEQEYKSATTAQGPHSVSCAAVPGLAPVDDGMVLRDDTRRAAANSPVRELVVVVDKASISLESLQKQRDLVPGLLSCEEKCPIADPSPRVRRGLAKEAHKHGDSPAPLPPPLLDPLVPGVPPSSNPAGGQAQLDPTDCCTCERNSAVQEGGRLGLVPTSVSSRAFQGLCLVLSKRQLVAVLGVGGGDAQRVSYAILQPITSLRATLTHIRPTKSAKLQELLRRAGRPSYSATAPARLGCHGDVGGGAISVAASELEIHANLSLLFPRQPRPTGLTEDLLQRHIDTVVSSSRSHGVPYCLLPWFSFHLQHGVSKVVLQHIQDSCPLSKQTPSSLSCSRTLSALKRAYGCCSVSGGEDCSVRGTDTAQSTTAGDGDRQTDSKGMEQGEAGKTSPPQFLAEAAEREPPPVEPGVVSTDTDTEPSAQACSNVEEVVTRFQEVYSQLLSDKSEPATLQRLVQKHFSWLQHQLDSLGEALVSFLAGHVLQTCASLKEKHTSPMGSPRSVTADSQLARELFLQIVLYLEAVSAGATEGLDCTSQIVSMCIASLPFTEVSPMGKLFQEVVLPSYVETCQSVLIDVYDELMWPLPPALGGNDVSVSFPEAKTLAAAEETQDTELSHDSHMTDMSPLKEYGAPRAPASTGSVRSAPLARQHSFHHGTAASKEIALASGKGRSKRKTRNRKVKPQPSPGVVSSKLSVKPSADDGKSNINRVKRSLFTRSYSTSETVSLREGVTSAASSPDSKARKRTRSDENDLFSTPKRRRLQRNSTIAWDISCVKETPLKKQVANPLKLKLQRARSKVNVSPDVLSVAETPKRSRLFYTQLPKCASQRRGQGAPAEGGHIAKKDPSPESLKALLHGRLTRRGQRVVQPPQSTDPQVEQLITDIIDESPSKNSSLDQSLSEDPLVAIACTPLRTSRPKQASLLDTPLKVGAVMGGADAGNTDAMAGSTGMIGGTSSKGEAFFTGSVNVFGQAVPTVPGGQDGVSPVATGFTTPVRRPPAVGSCSTLLRGHTDSPDLFTPSPCSGPGFLHNTHTTCTDGPTPSPTPIIPSCLWSSPQSAQFRREIPISMETDSHMAFLMSTPPRNRSALPTSFQGIFPKAE